ncbi:hypothetical protein GCM10010976_13940 [Bizionia arctica]|uniref:histidine kinase n=2 Tax=Bizionia arctica TaxID=1495645 RepID=A0A917LMN7_9FLAO|nr:HAMP domain-containing sensor histidine kinase [Bizionia arctica]GGG43628.1 hypothetical protein GCM10010976_13940 [Bizionia arctica]
MNAEMRSKLGLEPKQALGLQLEDLLTVGSKIFYQTHFYPMIKMQNTAREIYLSFKGIHGAIPVLLNVEVQHLAGEIEIICGGMEISNRNRYEKELIEAKKEAEVALNENAELKKVKNALVEQQQILESQFRKLKSLKQQQQEVFKLIAHDLQEPLRKSIFFSDYILTKIKGLPKDAMARLEKISGFSSQMSDMLLTLLRYKEIEDVTLNYRKIDLPVLIKNAIEELNIQNDKKISVTYPSTSPEFYGDNRMITRLIVELLKNSRSDKNPENKLLTIQISAIETLKNSFLEVSDKYQYDKFIKITYVDNGLGFRSNFSEIIKESEHFNKINIGLAYCKQIVEKHSGTIVATSKKGAGVNYTILLPILDSSEVSKP